MKTVVTLTLHDEALTQAEKDALPYLLADALGEFRVARDFYGVEQYVEKRYPLMEDVERVKKAAQVKSRCELAAKFHNAALGVRVEEVK